MHRAIAVFLILSISSAYAVVRYHQAALGSVGNDQLFGFIANKAIAYAALLCLTLSVGARFLASIVERWLAWLARDRRFLGFVGLGLAGIHALLSTILLDPAYFAKLYRDDGRMNLWGELSTLVGVVALVLLIWQSRLPAEHVANDRRVLRRLGLSGLALIAVHVAAIGWQSWIVPSNWPGYLPPITLISFITALVGLTIGSVAMGRSD
jgi:hypothetical protein